MTTALVLRIGALLGAAATLVAGAAVVAFEWTASPARAEISRAARQTPPERVEPLLRTLSGWDGSLVLPASARRLAVELRQKETPRDPAALGTALAKLLEVTPTSTHDWLSLAQSMSDQGRPAEALAFWRLSYIFGPREGHVMVQRAVLGIDHWSLLEPEDKIRTALQIATTASAYGEAYHVALMNNALNRNGVAQRQEIAGTVALAPNGPAALRRLGLN